MSADASGDKLDVAVQLSEQKDSKDGGNKKEILEIGVRCTIQNITEINTSAQTFTCRMKFKLLWFASPQDIESWESGGKDDLEWQPVSFVPTIMFTNALTPPEITVKDERDRLYEIMKKADKPTGKKLVGYDFSVFGTFMEMFELKSFPFDTQDMTMFLRLTNKGGSQFYRYSHLFFYTFSKIWFDI